MPCVVQVCSGQHGSRAFFPGRGSSSSLPARISVCSDKQYFRAAVGKLALGMALFLYSWKCNTCLNNLVKGIILVLICLPFRLGQDVNWYFVVYWLVASIDFSICPRDNSCLHIFRSWDSLQLEMIAFSDVWVFFSRLQCLCNQAIFYVNVYFKNRHFRKLLPL